VGIAKSDPLRMITQPAGTFERKGAPDSSERALITHVVQLCIDEEVSDIVIGLPLHMDGREGEGAVEARRVAAALKEQTGCEVHLWDERLSTVSANRLMTELGVKTKDKRGRVDQYAAELILQGYLDRSRPGA
jgi:putative holliday junction resolvase